MLLHIKIKPNQRFDVVEKIGADWQIRLNAPAIDEKANEHLIVFLFKTLNLPKSAIGLKKGHTSRYKTLALRTKEEHVQNKLNSALTA